MRVIRSCNLMSQTSRALFLKRKKIGFVPTMGALHEGHLSLVRQARCENDIVVVSIFVNPRQFGPQEDYRRYPRVFTQDAHLCQEEGVDFLFCPTVANMYPHGFQTQVEVRELSRVLCGVSRPGHFQGVTTVVIKLFNIVAPDVAYFGEKDIQQARIIQQMVKDLNIPVKIKVMPIIREKDGLAMSSRNLYLGPQERKDAAGIYQALKKARLLVSKGVGDVRKIKDEVRDLIFQKNPEKIDYIEIVDMHTFTPLTQVKTQALLVVAVWISKTRLIDNAILTSP